MEDESPPIFYEFESFRLDTTKRILWRGSQPVALTSRAFDTLVILVQNSGETVEKEALIAKVWGGAAVEENNLTQCISALRKVLGEGRSDHRFIITLPGHGYRFVADVKKMQPSPAAASPPLKGAITIPQTGGEYATGPASISRANGSHITSSLFRVAWLTAIGLLAIILVEILWGLGRAKHRANPLSSRTFAPEHKRTILAVLPFDNLTGRPSQDYLSDGFTEEIITQLGRIDPEHLGIIARTSVMRYRHTEKDIRTIAAELGVSYVLEGSVRQSGEEVRISAQFIRTSDQTPVWAQSYERPLRNTLALQEDVARAVQGAIVRRLKLTPASDYSRILTH